MPEITPDFEYKYKSTSIRQSFFNRNQEKLKRIRDEYKVDQEYPFEYLLTDAYVDYVKERKVISEKARKETSKSIQQIANLTDELISSIEQLDWETNAFLADVFIRSNLSLEAFLDHIKKTPGTYQLAIQDLLANIQNNREKLVAEDRLATQLTKLFCDISDKKPTIYPTKHGDYQYAGNLAKFLYLIDDLFHPIPDLYLLARAAKLRKGIIKRNPKK